MYPDGDSSSAVKLNKSNRRDVLLVTESATGRQVIVKQYPNEAEAMHEYRVLAACKGDRHFPRVLNFYDKDDQWHIVMEYVEGDTLKELVNDAGPMEIAKVVDLAIDLLTGVQALHQRGYVHGDLHGGNVVVTDFADAQVKLIDFQHSVTKLSTGKARAIRQIPKPHLMLAPESKIGVLDDSYDIYGVGYMCACMLSGAKLDKRPKESDLHPEAHALLNVIRKAMHKNPGKRYRSAEEMLLALHQLRNRMKYSSAMASFSRVARSMWSSNGSHRTGP